MTITLTLPDGKKLSLPTGATALDAAKKIGPKLADAAVCAKIDGKLIDLSRVIEHDAKFEVCTFDSPDGRSVFNHSCAHVLAQAVSELWPGTGLGVGPAVEEGFYYDFDKREPFSPEDLQKIEKKMHDIVKADLNVVRIERSKEDAKAYLKKEPDKNKFRLEILAELPEKTVSFYEQGTFVDLCRGPHAPSTGRIKAFSLLKVAGAYWRADAKNAQLQRIYGIAFPSQKQLDAHLEFLEKASARDHRKIAKELDLFSVDEQVGAGLILYHPKGAIIRTTIEDFIRREHFARGYSPVFIPHLFKSDIWKTSGHYDNYKENMFFTSIDEQEYGIKPMNCPGHITIFKSRSHSYRDLPVRLFELGTVYRQELSGVLSGLFRVRGFTQDDSHIFLSMDQLAGECQRVLEFALFMTRTFGFNDFQLTLSTKPEKAIGSEKNWETAEATLRGVLDAMKLPYVVDAGGGAFYGPKIDLKIKDALGRMWQCTTVQVDFNLPERFDLTYVGEDGQKHRVVMVHRALLGSIERFMGVLIEHYAGAFPLWLSPVQVALLPVADRHSGFAHELGKQFSSQGIRVKVDDSQEKIGSKIRNAQLERINYMLVIGDKEQESGTLVVRSRDGNLEEGVRTEEFIERLAYEIRERK